MLRRPNPFKSGMYDTIKLVKDNGVGIGAHPGLPDLKGFGRRNMDMCNIHVATTKSF
jgi:lactam utilization protein B